MTHGWLLHDKGCVTVRSCYRILQGEVEAPYASFWAKLWGLKFRVKLLSMYVACVLGACLLQQGLLQNECKLTRFANGVDGITKQIIMC